MTPDTISLLLPVFRRARDQLAQAAELIAAIDQELGHCQIYADEAGLTAAAGHTQEFAARIQALEDCLTKLRAVATGSARQATKERRARPRLPSSPSLQHDETATAFMAVR